jgi:hypothetical protein
MFAQIRFIPLLVVCLLLFCVGASAITKKEKTADHFGIKLGLVHGGTVDLETTEWETDLAPSFGVMFDFRVIRGFSLGLAIDMHKFSFSIGPYSDAAFMLNGSLVARQEIPLGKRGWLLRPGLGVGGGAMGKIGGLKNSTYLTVTPVIELLAPAGPRNKFLFELALLSGSGNDGATDISTGGLLLTRVGMRF